MEEISRRELAFRYIYSQEIQKDNTKAQVKIFLDNNEIENPKAREYVKDIANGVKENNEVINEIISNNLKKRLDNW